MSAACQELVDNATAGAAPALRAVDCLSNEAAATAFGRLFGGQGALLPALTILLTLYIGLYAVALLTGRARIGIAALTPRMMTLGLVLTFATSWIAYQSVVWNIAVGGPDQIAGTLLGARGSATALFADRIDIVFSAIADAASNAGVAASGQPQQGGGGGWTPLDLTWLSAVMLLLGTVGVLVTARIALAVCLAAGPIFVVFALFGGTRGLFVGWLRGVAMTAVVPLFVVVGGGLMLELIVPVVAGLTGPEGIDGRAAMSLFLIASVYLALMAMMLKVAGSIVSGWRVFGLAEARERGSDRSGAAAPAHAPPAEPQPLATAPSRRAAIVSVPAANDDSVAASGASNTVVRDRRVVETIGTADPRASASSTTSRARGLGSRFRAPNPHREILR